MVTVTIQFPEVITEDNEENLYYGGHCFMFQLKQDINATLFVVGDSLYYNKFVDIYTNQTDICKIQS